MTKELLNLIIDPKKTFYAKKNGQVLESFTADVSCLVPEVRADSFGALGFRQMFGLKYAYVGGAMVGGISSPAMVKALTQVGALGIYGSSGNPPEVVEKNVAALKAELPDRVFGCCVLNSPHDPSWEEKVTEIYLRHKMRLVEASAFMQLTPSLVRYRLSGVRQNPDGSIYAPNQIMAKVSRLELAKRFFAPAPDKIVKECVKRGWLTEAEAALAPHLPVAQLLTAEADSGGHTDFRPALSLWPAIVNLSHEYSQKYGYKLYVGAAGGIGTPWALLAAQECGASYFVTGSVNQSCVESGLSAGGRALLAKASQTDVMAGPAADMFELGAKVQVLRYGTLYAMRAQKLADTYRLYPSMEEISKEDKEIIEGQILKASLDDIWAQTKSFFEQKDPAQLEKAKDPKVKMALVFRWYLGQASRWAINGVEDRRADWQIFAGPAIGAFNDWAKGTIYEDPENRKVAEIAQNFLYGAAVLKRLSMAQAFGLPIMAADLNLKPRPAAELTPYL